MSEPTGGEGWKLQEICERLETDYDQARHVLAQGILPTIIPAWPRPPSRL